MPLAADTGEHDLRPVRQASIDAMALLSMPADHPAAQLARTRGIRLVTTDPDDDPGASWVAIDDVEAGRLVGRHLAALGHRDVTVLVETNRPAGSPARRLSVQQVTASDHGARLRGLAETIPGRLSLLSGGHNSSASGASAASHLVESSGPLPTAMVGLSDVIALGALSVFTERELSIPGTCRCAGSTT